MMLDARKELLNVDFADNKWIEYLRNLVVCSYNIDSSIYQNIYDYICTDNERLFNKKEIVLIDDFNKEDWCLYKLNKNYNVGGLKDNQEIVFSPIFSLIYGKNGTGKTTYYKLLKDAFYCNQNIKGNIYKNNKNEPNAEILLTKPKPYKIYQQKGIPEDHIKYQKEIHWEKGLRNKANIYFCDDSILSSSLRKKEAGWSIELFKLNYYETFRKEIDNIYNILEEHSKNIINDLKSNFDLILKQLHDNGEKSLYQRILKENNYKKKCEIFKKIIINYDIKQIHEKIEEYNSIINKNINDLTNKVDALTLKIEEFQKYLNYIVDIKKLCQKQKEIFKYKIKIKELKDNRDITKYNNYNLLFKMENDNVDDYINLLNEIKKVAFKYNYVDYPNDVKKCFYCNQKLDNEEYVLLNNLHEFSENKSQKIINQLEQNENEYKKQIYELKIKDLKSSKITNKEIYFINDHTKVETEKIIDNSDKLISNILNDLTNDNIVDSNILEIIIVLLKNDILKNNCEKNLLRKKLTTFEEEKKDAYLFREEYLDYQNIHNISDNLKEYEKKIRILDKLKIELKNIASVKTKISKEKGKIEKKFLQNKYLEEFEKYLKRFNIDRRCKIQRKFTNPSGQSLIDASIHTESQIFNISEILSEGEAKVFSICDWLTELKFNKINTVVFDDPISSLDHRNIDTFAKIIIELTKKYQVIVFTHNQEFYDLLLKKSIGTKALNKPKCELCKDEEVYCVGFKKNTGLTHKCGNYYRIEYTNQPGLTKKDIYFFRYSYEQRIEEIRKKLQEGIIDGVSQMMRTTINSFFETYILADIKRDVFKGEDLIHNWKRFKNINDSDYDELIELHNILSAKSIHEPSKENITEPDISDYINIFNRFINVLNKIRPEMLPISEIELGS